MTKEQLHQQLIRNMDRVCAWFRNQHEGLYIPFYSSYDIRDSGFKVVNVDANIYPAGFNNICQTDKEHADDLVGSYIVDHYGEGFKKILILAEEHTNNPYYWENVRAIQSLVETAGYQCRIGVPPITIKEKFTPQTIMGHSLSVEPIINTNGLLSIVHFEPDLVISNNDFSNSYLEWASEIKTPLNPPRELGWYQRKKSAYFENYNRLVSEFAKLIEIDPWYLTVQTELFEDFDVTNDLNRQALSEKVDAILANIQAKYDEHGITEKPFVFVKNNAGTYGLGVIQVTSGKEVLDWNYKSKKKMKAAKGGRDIEEVIIQEGVPTIVRTSNATAEPAIYLIGCQLAGGFLRTHGEKSERESLNSPGAVYSRLCVSDLKVDIEGKPLENVYGWVAKLGLLAIGQETRSMNIRYNQYKFQECRKS